MTVSQVRPGAAARRPWLAGCAMAGAIVLSSHGSATGTSPGDHLPSELLTALRLFPVDRSGSPSCLSIDGLRNRLAFPLAFGDRQVAVRSSGAYSPSTEGAYLGDGPVGVPAPLFVQALIDAGAAARIRLTWVRRVRTPTLSVPSLQDTGAERAVPAQNPPPASRTQEESLDGDAFIVTGPDKDLFSHDDANALAPSPPALATGDDQGSALPPRAVWGTGHICYGVVPDRVLEYGDPEDHGNGMSEVSAAILFHPRKVPAWIADPRVTASLRTVMLPDDVRVVTFRNDGDGWRPTQYPTRPLFAGRTHIMAVGLAP